MLAFETFLRSDIQSIVKGDSFWELRLSQLSSSDYCPFALHLAIFVEPYLQFVLDGQKTIESRFATRRYVPYKQVDVGDVVLLKRSGGPIVGICEIAAVWFYRLDAKSWSTIKREFAQALCAQDPNFWQSRQLASYATLMRLHHVRSIPPIKFTKRDRRGWVLLRSRNSLFHL